MFTALEIFDLAAQIEANGEQFYRHALTRVKRDSFRDLLGWLADQELLHKSAFTGIKEKIAREADDAHLDSSPISREVLSSAMGRHVFSLDELEIDSIRDEKEILEAALLFEEDTILFFEFISPFISDPEACSVLEKIRLEESNHKRLLLERISEIGPQ
jgi:rubrerythrin